MILLEQTKREVVEGDFRSNYTQGSGVEKLSIIR